MPRFRLVTTLATLCALLGATSVTTAAPPQQDRRLETLRHGLGTAAASALYHTHLFISATADGYKGKVFQADQVRQALKASAEVTTALMDDLGRVKSVDLPPEDIAKLDELISLCELVVKEARLISALVRIGTPETEQAFAEHHLKVRARLVKLMAL
jgi:hypothetical protein